MRAVTIDTKIGREILLAQGGENWLYDKVMDKYPRFTKGCPVYFTDGSRIEIENNSFINGYAVVKKHLGQRGRSEHRADRADGRAAIASVEAEAITEAIKWSREREENQFIIFTDSEAILRGVKKGWSGDNPSPTSNAWISCILENLTDLKNSGKKIALIWIPAHKGIAGNKEADKLAKEAAGIQDTLNQNPKKIAPEDLIRTSRIQIWNNWGSHLREIGNQKGNYYFVNFCDREKGKRKINKVWFESKGVMSRKMEEFS
ncbi:uncharacterized protein LOC108624800 [Ceratina calcarata]|uniref:ribonuclease H n=1 Tax=Ceratina calcarata TaxID=156304 RepID=A0AAJ7IXR9_9HYME|nr:uncharacterized protein LOC108624800 [Ceratina calcarata]